MSCYDTSNDTWSNLTQPPEKSPHLFCSITAVDLDVQLWDELANGLCARYSTKKKTWTQSKITRLSGLIFPMPDSFYVSANMGVFNGHGKIHFYKVSCKSMKHMRSSDIPAVTNCEYCAALR